MLASTCAGTADLQVRARALARWLERGRGHSRPASRRDLRLEFSFAGVDRRAASSRLDVLGGVADRRSGVSREVSGTAVDCGGFL